MTSEVLARTYGTHPVVLRRVLAKLKRAGLVSTRRGVGGGSVLARDAADIHLGEIYEAIRERPEILGRHPGDSDEAGCGPVAQIVATYVNELTAEAEQALLGRLAAVTVEQMDIEVRGRIFGAVQREDS